VNGALYRKEGQADLWVVHTTRELATGKRGKNGMFATVHRKEAETRATVGPKQNWKFLHTLHGVVELQLELNYTNIFKLYHDSVF
jgi:hypothetical protein